YTFEYLIETLSGNSHKKFFNVPKLGGTKYDILPYSIRVLLEAAVRNCDGFLMKKEDVMNILDWKSKQSNVEVPFFPARVVLQDFTGIPAMVDFAAMREAVKSLGGDPKKVHPACPADLTVDHSLQIDFMQYRMPQILEVVTCRKQESSPHLKCSLRSFRAEARLPAEDHNVAVIPPGTGMAHQVNLEYLSRVVFEEKDLLFPDSVVGTDSHITMVNGLGILGWGVGGIETEAVMLGLPVTLTLPEVVGCELTGSSNAFVTSIDIVLGITKHLRQVGVAGKFVEFFGSGVSQLSIVDRTTIANMCPEYGAILSFFPVDNVTLRHLEHTGFDKTKLESMEKYLKAVKLFRNDENSSEPEYSQVIKINLNSIVASVSGPKRPQDRVAITDMKSDFQACLNEKVGFKGFQVAAEKQSDTVSIHYDGSEYKLSHGSVVIAAVISCTNNCNPSVMLAAGLLAKKAVETGLRVKPYIRTSLSPGSGMVTHYLSSSGVLPYLSKLGFEIVGYGCSTCVGNTAPLSEAVLNAVKQGDLVTCGVLSGNKNFEGRLCDCVRANYLASPPLVVAYAIAGTVNIDFQTEPLGTDSTGKEIYLHDIWPSREEVHQIEEEHMGNKRWSSLEAPESVLFPWDVKSTYIRCPSFFDKLTKEPAVLQPIDNAHVLLYLGDSVTTDHISPAGSIARSSAAAKYLTNRGSSVISVSCLMSYAPPKTPGVKAVLAESYEKIHKDHLIGIGIAPLEFLPGENADSLGLSGREVFSLSFPEELSPGITLNMKTSTGKEFSVIASFENDVEITLYKHGGLLNFVARKFS
ncbi:hypothetical protein A6R68_21438, partial [Neotoma lepida]